MNSRKNPVVLAAALLVILALLGAGCTPRPAAAPPPATATPLAPAAAVTQSVPVPTATDTPAGFDPQVLNDLTYHLDILAEALPGSDGLARLVEGHFEQAYPDSASTVVVDLADAALGDLNGDGAEDAVAVLAVNTGGSGVFVHLVAVLQQAGQPLQAAQESLGDRVRVESLQVEDGQMRIELLTHGPDDPMCCPSQPLTVVYQLEGDRLQPQE